MTYKPMLGFLLHEVARLLRRRFEQHARGLGLTRSQWQVLFFLAANEGIHQGGLADLLDVEPITLGRILDKLQQRRLVERRRHPTDRRIWLLYLTPAAHPLLASMRELGDLTRTEALAGIPDVERDRLLRTLGTMKTNLLDACARPAGAKDGNDD
jgi:DNA-binding MarR family transcriptional regulator